MDDQEWLDYTSSSEFINLSDTEKLLELMSTGLDGEIHSDYSTIHTLKCHIKDDGTDLTYLSDSFLMPEGAPAPVTYQIDGYGLGKKFYLKINNIPFLVPEGLSTISLNFGKDIITGKFDKLKAVVEEAPCYLRSVHRMSPSNTAHAASFFKTLPFRAKSDYRGAGMIKFSVNNVPYKLFDFELNDTRYFIVDSESPILKKEFDAVISALILAYAFITGFYICDRTFTIYSLKPDFTNINCFDYEKPNLETKVGITALAPRHIKDYFPNSVENPYLEPKILSNLIQSAMVNVGIFRALEILADSLDYPESIRGAVYSVVLETLKDQIINNKSPKFNPIKEKITAQYIRNAFNEIINDLPDEAFNDKAAILKKIAQINQIGNLDGFYKIFEDRGIMLNDHDQETIKHRNNFLHGRLPADASNISEDNKYLTGIILKMHLLISTLLLTDAGYDGYYFNHYKYRLKNGSGEPLYRKLYSPVSPYLQ